MGRKKKIRNKQYNITINLVDDRKIRLSLNTKYAPQTVEHFVKLIRIGYFNGTIFHRTIKDFMIQTGGYFLKLEEPNNYLLTELPQVAPIKGEFASNGFENTLKHTAGVISMARTMDPNSATGQFFICAETCPHLDGQYAAFGEVMDEESLQVVRDIANGETYVLSKMFENFPTNLLSVVSVTIDEELEEK